MKCKKAEKRLSRNFDSLLDEKDKQNLRGHLASCPSCRNKQAEYRKMLEVLRKKDFPEPLPNFWERLRSRIEESRTNDHWSLWKQWSIRAVPVSLLVVILLAALIVFVLPQRNEELSKSEVLLLRNHNPFQETRPLLEEKGIEDKNMMLIFASLDEINGTRRYFP